MYYYVNIYIKYIYMMEIKYGIKEKSIDITKICLEKLLQNEIINIPLGDDNRVFFWRSLIWS